MTSGSSSQTAPADEHGCSDSRIRVIDLFAGAGGLTQGFQSTGRFAVVGAVEHDVHAAATYALNHGEHVFVGDIQAYTTGSFPRAEVLLGGPPCQGFSLLGKRDAMDPRNRLWEDYLTVLQRVRPAFFVMENVPQFLDSPDFQRLSAEARSEGLLDGWELEAWILNAADHGVAQSRRRAFVIGRRSGMRPIGRPGPDPARRSVRDALGDLEAQPQHRRLPLSSVEVNNVVVPGAFKSSDLHFMPPQTSLALARYASIPYGGSRLDLPEHLQARCWRGFTRGAGDVLGRLVWDRPATTIRTEFYRPEKGRFLHPVEHRPISHHEAARIQGFPDDYLWAGTRTTIARQIGNAVPPPLASAIARVIEQRLHHG